MRRKSHPGDPGSVKGVFGRSTRDAPTIICQGCGRPLPKLRIPIPESRDLAWDELRYRERRLVGAYVLFGERGGDMFCTWSMMEAHAMSGQSYRQVANCLRRLVACGWVVRMSRGRYRISSLAAERVAPAVAKLRAARGHLPSVVALAEF